MHVSKRSASIDSKPSECPARSTPYGESRTCMSLMHGVACMSPMHGVACMSPMHGVAWPLGHHMHFPDHLVEGPSHPAGLCCPGCVPIVPPLLLHTPRTWIECTQEKLVAHADPAVLHGPDIHAGLSPAHTPRNPPPTHTPRTWIECTQEKLVAQSTVASSQIPPR